MLHTNLFLICSSLVNWRLHIHTIPNPTPMLTTLPHMAECDDRYSDGNHATFIQHSLSLFSKLHGGKLLIYIFTFTRVDVGARLEQQLHDLLASAV